MFILGTLNKRQLKLFEEHKEDAEAMVRTFSLAGWNEEEKDSLAYEALLTAIKYFDPTREEAKFTTYLYFAIRSAVLNIYKKEKREKERSISVEKPVPWISGEEIALIDVLEDIEAVKVYDYLEYIALEEKIKEILTPKEFQIVQLIKSGYKQRDIAKYYKTVEPAISKIIKRIREKVQKVWVGE